jgi:16S rRNA (cytidine1402-2'-O)-methyltransferase
MAEEVKPGTLYVVGTPIGNLEDMTFRAIKILQNVDAIAAEDTRHTGKLRQHFQINTPQISYHEHNQQKRQEELLRRLREGESIALVTDAGMPGISDPGYDLVKACIEAGITVVPIPGVTAVITALVAAGLPTDRFVFEGFLPTQNKERNNRLEILKDERRTIVFYGSPHRLIDTLTDLAATFGEYRQIVLARELTKLYEEFWRGRIKDAISLYQEEKQPKGEYTLVVAGAPEDKKELLTEAEVREELQKLFDRGISKSQASKQLAHLTSMPRQYLYKIALSFGNVENQKEFRME